MRGGLTSRARAALAAYRWGHTPLPALWGVLLAEGYFPPAVLATEGIQWQPVLAVGGPPVAPPKEQDERPVRRRRRRYGL